MSEFKAAWHLLVRLCDPEFDQDSDATKMHCESTWSIEREMLRLAADHRILGLVLPKIYENEHLDRKAILASYRKQYWSEVVVSTALRAETIRIQKKLKAAGINNALLKGASFADRLYPQPVSRVFRDIDLLVPEEDFSKAIESVCESGYSDPQSSGEQKYQKDYGQVSLRSPSDDRFSVEIHRDLINSPSQRKRSSVAWHRLHWENHLGHGPQLTSNSMLLIAAVHATHSHRFDSLQQLCDIRQLCRGRGGRIDSHELRALAKDCRCTTALSMALAATEAMFHDAEVSELRAAVGHTWAGGLGTQLVSPKMIIRSSGWVSGVRRTILREVLKQAA